MRVSIKFTCFSVVLLANAACDVSEVRLIDPVSTDDPSRTVTITARLEDSTLARALGWENGVPGAEISVYRILEEFRLRIEVTDSLGTVRLHNMLPGQYRIASSRVLRDDETGPTRGLVRAFGDGLTVWVDPPQQLELTLGGDRLGSLLMSEVRGGGRYEGPGSHWPDYNYFSYFELYNNADTTVYLDGMLWGQGFFINRDGVNSCDATEPFRNDPTGIWTWYFHQFPGTGIEYPIAPGQTAIVAQDAVDHSVVHPSLPDLSGADFELLGTADTDNPDVPNMPEVGPVHNPSHTHGVPIECSSTCFIAQSLEVASLVRQRDYFFNGQRDWVRIPRESLLDVITTGIWDPGYDGIANPCAVQVHRSFDRLGEPLYEVYYDVTIAMQRRVLRVAAGSQPVLQDVNVSFTDFILGERSPGWIEH